MKKIWLRILCLGFLSIFAINSEAVVAVHQPVEEIVQSATSVDLQIDKAQITKENKNWRSSKLKKRFKKFTKRFLKKNNSFGNVLTSRKFRIGALLFLVGLIGAIVINVISLAQIFGWLAGVIALAGLVLMIWSLIEHS
ncbi:MAG: hypothetical protein AB8F74_06560 [Saprospiraceae bacterium]